MHAPEEAGNASAGSAVGLDSSSALIRAEAEHLEATLGALVTRLGAVPGLNIAVSFRQGKLRRFLGDLPYINDLNGKTGPIQRIVISVGAHTYALQRVQGTIRCGREPLPPKPGQLVEELTFGTWAKALFEEIARQNLVNHDSLVALRRLVEHDRVG